jgi:hypothetical protein
MEFAANRTEIELIVLICKRFEALCSAANVEPPKRSDTLMDLDACHSNGCALNLNALAHEASDFDVLHDVGGIARHLDRETGKLGGCFSPRYAARYAREAA